MNCQNTVTDGFNFWIGKSIAELLVAMSMIAIVAVIYGVLLFIFRKKT